MVKINVHGVSIRKWNINSIQFKTEKHYGKWVKRTQMVEVTRSCDQCELLLSRYYKAFALLNSQQLSLPAQDLNTIWPADTVP